MPLGYQGSNCPPSAQWGCRPASLISSSSCFMSGAKASMMASRCEEMSKTASELASNFETAGARAGMGTHIKRAPMVLNRELTSWIPSNEGWESSNSREGGDGSMATESSWAALCVNPAPSGKVCCKVSPSLPIDFHFNAVWDRRPDETKVTISRHVRIGSP